MADPQMVVRVAANLSEFRANIQDQLIGTIDTTKGALASMSTAFDGSKILAQAGAVVASIQQMGGVTALTAAEQAKANTILDAAISKYAALGKDAPAGMAALAAATKQVVQPTEELGQSWVARIAEGLLLRDAINEVLGKVKELVVGVPEEAHALNILSLQTQINVEDLQVLSAATREYGVDGDQLGRALFQLSRRIAGGDESVATAYHLMGMSIEQVRGLNAMELFLTTERGLGKLQGTIRDTAAADLYGGRLGVSMGAFATGVDEAMEKARRLNTIASTESVKAAAEYAEAIDRATHSVHAWVMEVEGGAAKGFNVLTDAVDKGASTWDLAVAMMKDFAASSLHSGASTSNLATLLDKLNQKTDENTKKTGDQKAAHEEVTVAMTAQTAAFHFMAALELDSAKPLLDWQAEYLGHLKDIGELNAKNAAAIGVNADQFKRYEDASRKAAEEDKKNLAIEARSIEEVTKLWDEYFTLRVEHGGTSTDKQIAQIHQWADDLAARMHKAGADTQEFYDALGAVTTQKLDGVKVDWAALGAASKEALQQTYEKAQATYEAAASSSLHFSAAAMQHFRDLRDAARDALYDVDGVAESTFDKMNDKVMGITSTFDGWNKAIMKTADALAKVAAAQAALDKGNTLDLATAAQDPAIMEFLHQGYSLKNAEALKLGRLYGFTPSLFDEKGNPETAPSKGERVPGYADGVINAPGGWSVVGERGPERMYVPAGANIYPTGSGAGATVTNIFNVNGTIKDLVRPLMDEITKSMRQARQWPAA